jgi:hypothetical protein
MRGFAAPVSLLRLARDAGRVTVVTGIPFQDVLPFAANDVVITEATVDIAAIEQVGHGEASMK